MTLYNEILPEFRKHDAELLGISVVGVWCHAAFARDRHLHFPLLADFEPKGDVARKYRAYRASEGVCERALFVLDRQGIIASSYCSPIAVNPSADGIPDALEKLSDQAKHSRSERDSDRTGVDDSKTFPGLTTISAASRFGNYPSNSDQNLTSNSDQNLRRKPWLPSQGSERL
jgi:hypothetical protein